MRCRNIQVHSPIRETVVDLYADSWQVNLVRVLTVFPIQRQELYRCFALQKLSIEYCLN
jgi:hypothetical protein